MDTTARKSIHLASTRIVWPRMNKKHSERMETLTVQSAMCRDLVRSQSSNQVVNISFTWIASGQGYTNGGMISRLVSSMLIVLLAMLGCLHPGMNGLKVRSMRRKSLKKRLWEKQSKEQSMKGSIWMREFKIQRANTIKTQPNSLSITSITMNATNARSHTLEDIGNVAPRQLNHQQKKKRKVLQLKKIVRVKIQKRKKRKNSSSTNQSS